MNGAIASIAYTVLRIYRMRDPLRRRLARLLALQHHRHSVIAKIELGKA